jgi:hypothetical protein
MDAAVLPHRIDPFGGQHLGDCFDRIREIGRVHQCLRLNLSAASEGQLVLHTFFEFSALGVFDKIEKGEDVLDLLPVESKTVQQFLVGAKRKRIGSLVKLEQSRIVQFEDYVVKILEHPEGRYQAVIVALARPSQQIEVIFVIVSNELIEIFLRQHRFHDGVTASRCAIVGVYGCGVKFGRETGTIYD